MLWERREEEGEQKREEEEGAAREEERERGEEEGVCIAVEEALDSASSDLIKALASAITRGKLIITCTNSTSGEGMRTSTEKVGPETRRVDLMLIMQASNETCRT